MESTELLRDGFRDQTDSDLDNGRHPAPGQGAGSPRINEFAPDDGRYVTLEEYWAKWYENPYPDIDVSYEWNNGILEAKPMPNAPQLDLGNWFLVLLLQYINTHGIAKLINMETGFHLKMMDSEEPSGMRQAVRKPDIGIILNDNPVSWGEIEQRHFAGHCDAVVELLSDSTQAEVRRDTEEKKRDYALAGVKEYTILDPSGPFDCRQGPADGVGDNQNMHFYRLTPAGRYEEIQPDAEGVIGSTVLPGFQFRQEDLERQPDLAELALDDVYAGYVIPDFKVAVIARRVAEEQAAAEAAARQVAEEQAAVEAGARRKAEERAQALEAELARLRRQSS